jgi:hypothetical protein
VEDAGILMERLQPLLMCRAATVEMRPVAVGDMLAYLTTSVWQQKIFRILQQPHTFVEAVRIRHGIPRIARRFAITLQ